MAGNFNQAGQFASLTGTDGVQYIIIEDMGQPLEIDARSGQDQIIVQGLPQEMLQPNSEIILEDGTRAIIQGVPQSLAGGTQQVLIQDGQETLVQEIPQGMIQTEEVQPAVSKSSGLQETAQIVFHDEAGNVLHTDNPVVVQDTQLQQPAATSSHPRSLLRQRSPEKKNIVQTVSTSGISLNAPSTNGHVVTTEMPAEILQSETVVETSISTSIPETATVAVSDAVSAAASTSVAEMPVVVTEVPAVTPGDVTTGVTTDDITTSVIDVQAPVGVTTVVTSGATSEVTTEVTSVTLPEVTSEDKTKVIPEVTTGVTNEVTTTVATPTVLSEATTVAATTDVTVTQDATEVLSPATLPASAAESESKKPAEPKSSMASTVITIKSMSDLDKPVPDDTKTMTRRSSAAKAKDEPVHTTVTADVHVSADVALGGLEMEVTTSTAKPAVNQTAGLTTISVGDKKEAHGILPTKKPEKINLITTPQIPTVTDVGKLAIKPGKGPAPAMILTKESDKKKAESGTVVVKVVPSAKPQIIPTKPQVKVVGGPKPLVKQVTSSHVSQQVKVVPPQAQFKHVVTPKPQVVYPKSAATAPKPGMQKVVVSPRGGFKQVVTTKPGPQLVTSPKAGLQHIVLSPKTTGVQKVVVSPKPSGILQKVIMSPKTSSPQAVSPRMAGPAATSPKVTTSLKPGAQKIVSPPPAKGGGSPLRVESTTATSGPAFQVPKILVQPADDEPTEKEPEQVPTSTTTPVAEPEPHPISKMEVEEGYFMELDEKTGLPVKKKIPPPVVEEEITPRRRGRPKKTPVSETLSVKPDTTAGSPATEESEPEEQPPKRGRGRRSVQNKAEEKEEKAEEKKEPEAPKRRGRPPRRSTLEAKSPEPIDKEDQDTEEEPSTDEPKRTPGRRGRPPKVAKAVQEVTVRKGRPRKSETKEDDSGKGKADDGSPRRSGRVRRISDRAAQFYAELSTGESESEEFTSGSVDEDEKTEPPKPRRGRPRKSSIETKGKRGRPKKESPQGYRRVVTGDSSGILHSFDNSAENDDDDDDDDDEDNFNFGAVSDDDDFIPKEKKTSSGQRRENIFDLVKDMHSMDATPSVSSTKKTTMGRKRKRTDSGSDKSSEMAENIQTAFGFQVDEDKAQKDADTAKKAKLDDNKESAIVSKSPPDVKTTLPTTRKIPSLTPDARVKVTPPEHKTSTLLSSGKRIGIQWNKMKFTVDRPSNGGNVVKTILQKSGTTPEPKRETEQKGKLSKKKEGLEAMEKDLQSRETQVSRREQKLKALDRELDDRTTVLKGKEGQIQRLVQQLKAKEQDLKRRERLLQKNEKSTGAESSNSSSKDKKSSDKKLDDLEKRVKEKEKDMKEKEKELKEQEKALKERERLLEKTEGEVSALGQELFEKFQYLQGKDHDFSEDPDAQKALSTLVKVEELKQKEKGKAKKEEASKAGTPKAEAGSSKRGSSQRKSYPMRTRIEQESEKKRGRKSSTEAPPEAINSDEEVSFNARGSQRKSTSPFKSSRVQKETPKPRGRRSLKATPKKDTPKQEAQQRSRSASRGRPKASATKDKTPKTKTPKRALSKTPKRTPASAKKPTKTAKKEGSAGKPGRPSATKRKANNKQQQAAKRRRTK